MSDLLWRNWNRYPGPLSLAYCPDCGSPDVVIAPHTAVYCRPCGVEIMRVSRSGEGADGFEEE